MPRTGGGGDPGADTGVVRGRDALRHRLTSPEQRMLLLLHVESDAFVLRSVESVVLSPHRQ